ncbi:hypothetical protein [Helicobacter sp. 23-1045]
MRVILLCGFIIFNALLAQNLAQNPQNLAQNPQNLAQNPQNLAPNSQNPQNLNPQNLKKPHYILPQKPLIVEYDAFKQAEKFCATQKGDNLSCLIGNLRPFSGHIWTKISGGVGHFAVIFYALDSKANITHARGIKGRFCEFYDTLGGRHFSELRGDGISYVVSYPFNASSSRNPAFISCGFTQGKAKVAQTSQPISVIPHSIHLNVAFVDAKNNLMDLSIAQNLTLKAQNNPLLIAPNATARTANGAIDRGFSEKLVPLYVRFRADSGLCASVGEQVTGSATFKNGRLVGNNLSVNFSDVANGELEIAFVNKLDWRDRMEGKCVDSANFSAESNFAESPAHFAQNAESTLDSANFGAESHKNAESNFIAESTPKSSGKIPCQRPIVFKKRVSIIPHSFSAILENNGRMLYYNQHSFIPAIPYLPFAKLTLNALNSQNLPLKNFTSTCYARDLSIKFDDKINNFIFINENMPDSIIPKNTFLDASISRVVRKISVSGIKDRDLTPLDLFNSRVVNLNDGVLQVEFLGDLGVKYAIKPLIKKDWRIALMRGKIALLPNANANESLVANPKIAYQFFCKSPACKIVDIESVISPRTRLPKANAGNWYVNTAHWRDFKVVAQNLALGENISVFSLGSVVNGVQTLALKSTQKGKFDIKITQGSGENDFAQFLYFSPAFENIREDLGESVEIEFR